VYQLWSPSIRAASTGGQHVEAEVAMEDVAAGERLLVLGGVELGNRVDDVQFDVGSEALEHLARGLAPQRADLDDAPAVDRLEDRRDGELPERKHWRCPLLPAAA
jgi:hypothetical protein